MVIFLANQFVSDSISSGGDVLFTKILENIESKSVVLVPKNVATLFSKRFKKANIVQTDQFLSNQSASTLLGGTITILQYLLRAFKSSLWLSKNANTNDTIYLTGDFICNSLPAWIIKSLKPEISIVANFYHRNSLPSQRNGNKYLVSLGSRLLQTISLKLIRSVATTIFVLSQEGKNELLQMEFDQTKIVICGAGIDKKKIAQFKNMEKKRNQLIYVGRVNVTKGVYNLISILKFLNPASLDWHCHIVGQGSGEDTKRLSEKVRDVGLSEKITIHGYLSDDRKYELLASSSVLLLPSKEEGFGIVIMEAIALRTQVICYGLPALKSLYRKFAEVHFIKPNHLKAFARTIVKIIHTNEPDPTPLKLLPDWSDIFKLQSPYLIGNKNEISK